MATQITNTFTVIIKGQPGAYTIEAHSPKGIRVDRQPFMWSPTSQQKAVIADLTSEKPSVSPDQIRELGKALYDALFIPPIATAFGRAQGSARADHGVRLRLQIEPPELASLPWEAMYDGQSFLSTRSDNPLVRALPGKDGIQPIKRLQVRGALRILFVGASPQGPHTLKLEQAAAELRQLLGEAISKKRIVLDVLTDATLEELRSKLLQNYHVLYFAGHGTVEGIYLDDGMGGERDPRSGKRPAGDPYPVTAQMLAQELEGKATRLVFLAACKTGALSSERSGLLAGFAQELARLASLPAIVAMQYPIGNPQANQLTARFFESLSAFYPVDVALAEARKSLIRPRLPAGRDVISPVMYLQAECGELFRRARNWAAWVLAVILPVLVLVGIWAVIAQRTAQTEIINRATAEAQAHYQGQIAQARQLATHAQTVLDNTDTGLVRSVLLAVESLRRAPTLDGDQALRHGLALLPHPSTRMVHGGAVNTVVFSPNGKWLATGSEDRTVRIWEVATGQEVAHMGQESQWFQVAFSPDSRWLATTGGSKWTVQIWEATTGQLVTQMAHESAVPALAFSPDGKWLATGSWDGTARVWETTTGREVARMVHDDRIQVVAFSPDGKWLATGSWDGTARVWETTTGREVARMVHEGETLSVTFSADGHWLATGSLDGTARIWKVSTGQEAMRMTHGGDVWSVAFSPDSKWLATGSEDRTARIWEVSTGREVAKMLHENSVLAVTFSPNSKWLATLGRTETVRVWEVATGREVARTVHNGGVNAMAFSPDGKWLATATDDGTAQVWDAAFEQRGAWITYEGVTNVAFSPDSKWLAMGNLDGTVRVREVGGKQEAMIKHKGEVWHITFSPDGKWLATTEAIGEWSKRSDEVWVWEAATGRGVAHMAAQGGVSNIAFSPNGKWLASLEEQRPSNTWETTTILRVWEAAIGQQVAQVTTKDMANNMAFSPDGRWLAVGYSSGKIRVWEMPDGREVAEMEHLDGVYAVDFSPDSKWLATGGGDGWVRIWATNDNWTELATMGHEGSVADVAFSPDGRWLATASWDHTARIWDVITGQEITRMGHEDIVDSVAFSSDGRWLATQGDRTNSVSAWEYSSIVRFWATTTKEEVARITFEEPVRAITLSPNGEWLATVTVDNTARLWGWWTEDLIAEACTRLPRNLTQEEWNQYFSDEPYQATCPGLSDEMGIIPSTAKVNTDELIIYSCPSETCQGKSLTSAKGTEVKVKDCLDDGSWCLIILPNRSTVWCKGEVLQFVGG
jgi:WD40 repeat protein/CHAT domain-containing protein